MLADRTAAWRQGASFRDWKDAMQDDDFEPRLGRIGHRGRETRYLGLVLKAAHRAGRCAATRSRRFDGSRIGRGAALARVLGSGDRNAAFRARRVVIKTRLVRLAGKGLPAARAHLRYLERDGVTRKGAPGELYAREDDSIDGKAFVERSAGDRHQFRFIVSAEDGDQYHDLKPFVRRLMRQMENDLGTRLDWVAVDHFNTGHPHSHIVLRGKDDRGANLVIAREYISQGLRERASRIVTLDLGPRTDLEIEARLRADITAERLTAIDRQLLRDADPQRAVDVTMRDPMRQSLRIGRLRKLEALGLAESLDASRWRLAEGFDGTLRRMGERGDIVRTMQRALSDRRLDRAPADQVVFDPRASGAAPLVGRVLARGLADELEDRHYLIVDGADGRTHYVDIGRGGGNELLPRGAVVRVTPAASGVREVDRTIVAVAAANGGRYAVDHHMRHDPSASAAFAEAHVRRLEAMRRRMSGLEREPNGDWVIAHDHLDKVARFEARVLRDRPVALETLSTLSVERLPKLEAATMLDRDLVAAEPLALRDAGFGRELRMAREARRQWLIAQDLAEERDGVTLYRKNLIALLQRRELLRVAGALSDELDLPFNEAVPGARIEGQLVRAVDLDGGRYALVERSRDFTLVPWRPALEKRIGQSVSGIVRESGINWSFGRQRSGPSIS